MFFTQDDYKKIQQWLIKNSVKDTEFNEANIPFNGEETITIVQGNQNKKVFLKDLIAQVFNLGISDFVNITDKYDAPNISLEEAVRLIPSRARKTGQVITFLNKDDNWQIYQFKGALNQWNVLDTWEDLFDLEESIIETLLPDEEDLTKSITDEEGNSYLSLKDRDYNPKDFSGLGRVILRKNIVEIEDHVYGKVKNNILNQDMINKTNTIYEIRYDFDLNSEEITIPEGCILDFQGGSFSNGSIIGNNNTINFTLNKIFNTNLNIRGNWNVDNFYAEWFGAIGNGENDDTEAINASILFAAYNKGGKVRLLDKIYKVTTINLLARVVLEGTGISSTILQQYNANIDTPLINVVKNGTAFAISNMTLSGDTINGIGIYMVSNINTAGGNNVLNEKIEYENLKEDYVYKNCKITELAVRHFDTGIAINNNYSVFISNLRVNHNNRYGITSLGTDNLFDTMYIEYNGLYGIYGIGRNNKFSNLKIIFNGNKINVPQNTIETLGGGIHCLDGANNDFINIELQDNYGNNIIFTDNTKANSFSNVLLDTIYGKDFDTAYRGQHIILRGYDNYIQGIVADYRGLNVAVPVLYIPRKIYKDANQINLNDSREYINVAMGNVDTGIEGKLNYPLIVNRNSAVTVDSISYGKYTPVINTSGYVKQSNEIAYFYNEPITLNRNFTLNITFICGDLTNNYNPILNSPLSIGITNKGILYLSSFAPASGVSLTDKVIFPNFTFITGNTYKLTIVFGARPILTSGYNFYDLDFYLSYYEKPSYNVKLITERISNAYSFDKIPIQQNSIKVDIGSNNIYKELLFTYSNVKYNKYRLGGNISSESKSAEYYSCFGGYDYIKNSTICNSSNRPSDVSIGKCIFDAELNKPIWWTGTKWVDATGADV